MRASFSLAFDPLTPKSDYYLIPPYKNTAESLI